MKRENTEKRDMNICSLYWRYKVPAKELADIFGVSASNIFRIVKKQKFDPVNVGDKDSKVDSLQVQIDILKYKVSNLEIKVAEINAIRNEAKNVYNKEHYKDPTAYMAMKKIEKNECIRDLSGNVYRPDRKPRTQVWRADD